MDFPTRRASRFAHIPCEIARTADDLTTPPSLLSELWRLGAITLDPASNPWSDVGARVELSRHRGEDGLAADWASIVRAHMPDLDAGGYVLVVPPFDEAQLCAWAEKVAHESARGVEVITLVPKRTDASWWRLLWSSARARCDLGVPVAFDGGREIERRASTLFYSGLRPYVFAHVFAHLGEPRFHIHTKATFVVHETSFEPNESNAGKDEPA